MSTTQSHDNGGEVQLEKTTGTTLSRRGVLAGIGAAGAAAAAPSAAAQSDDDTTYSEDYTTCSDTINQDMIGMPGDDLGIAISAGLDYLAPGNSRNCWVEGSDEAQEDAEYYASAVSMANKKSEMWVSIENNITNLETLLETDAKLAFARAYMEDKSLNNCYSDAIQSMADRASKIQENNVNAWSTAATDLMRIRQGTAETHDIDPAAAKSSPLFTGVLYNSELYEPNDHNFSKNEKGYYDIGATDSNQVALMYTEERREIELVNGDIIDYRIMRMGGDGIEINTHMDSYDYDGYVSTSDGYIDPFSPVSASEGEWWWGVAATMPDYSQMQQVAKPWKVANLNEAVIDAHDTVKSRLGTTDSGYLHDVYRHLENGVISISGDPENSFLTASEWAQMTLDSDDIGTKTWYDAHMAAMGVGGLTGESSATVTVHADSKVDGAALNSDWQIEANIYSEAPPTTNSDGEPTWKTETKYSTSNIGGEGPIVLGYYLDGGDGKEMQYKRVQVEGEFTLNELRNTDTGETTDTAGHTDRDYDTTDPKNYEALVEDIQKDIQDLSEQADEDPGITNPQGGGINLNLDAGGIPTWVWAIPGVGIVLLVILVFAKIAGD